MANIISGALRALDFRIPPQILKATFKDAVPNYRVAPVSIHDQITNKVIRPRVLEDLNLVGGQHVVLNIEAAKMVFNDMYSVVYEIPPELIQNREIISVLSCGYMPFISSFNTTYTGLSSMATSGSNDITGAAQRVSDSMSSIPVISNASVDLIGYNTIILRECFRASGVYQLRCIVANDEHLNNISPRSHLHFFKLVEFAVKAYIYNNMIITIDQAALSGGQELGAFKSQVEAYSDASESYQTYLTDVMQGTLFMNDNISHTRFITQMIGSAY